MSLQNGTAELAKALKAVERDNVSGSIELAHKAIMGLYKARQKSARPESLDERWLRWAKRARPECKVFANLAREASKKSGRAAWARTKLPFWLLTVLYNSVSKTIKSGAALVKPGSRILVFSYSSTIVHAITLAKGQLPEVLVVKHPHSLKAGRLLQKEHIPVRVVGLDELLDGDMLFIGCDSYDGHGSIINAKGTGKLLEMARERSIPAYCLTTWLKFSPSPLKAPANRAFEKVNIKGKAKLVGDL